MSKSKAGIRIMGKGLDLADITANIGIDPTHAHKAGEPSRAGEIYEQDLWTLNSPLEQSKNLDAHLKWLINQLKPHYRFIISLKSSAKVDVFCSHTTDKAIGGLSLSPKSLSIFAELGVKLELSLITLRP